MINRLLLKVKPTIFATNYTLDGIRTFDTTARNDCKHENNRISANDQKSFIFFPLSKLIQVIRLFINKTNYSNLNLSFGQTFLFII